MTNDKNNKLTKGQKFASKAYELVQVAAGKDDKDKYKTVALGFPVLILSCGLAQAVSFACGKPDYQNYLADLNEVVKVVTGKEIACVQEENGKPKCHDKKISEFKTVQLYMRITRDVLEASTWIKRYAEAEIPKKNGAEK